MMDERYKMEYVNEEVGIVTDTYENKELTAEEITDLLNNKDRGIKELDREVSACYDSIYECEKTAQDYEDLVHNFFLENENEFSSVLKDEISLLFDVEWRRE